MRGPRLLIAALAIGLVAWALPPASARAGSHPAWLAAVHPALTPLPYEPNVGQFPHPVLFAARAGGFALLLERTGLLLLHGRADSIRLRFTGARTSAAVQGARRLRERVNYFLGRNPARWHTDVPTYARVTYRDLYPGIDLRLRGTTAAPEFDWIVRPGANPGRIGLRIAGARILGGAITVRQAGATLALPAPAIYQQIGGRTVRVAGRYRLEHGTVRLALGRYDRSQPLVIDPRLVFSRLVGGSNGDNVNAVTTDTFGNTFVAGDTQSADFPTVGGLPNTAFQKTCSPSDLKCSDVFVMELSPNGAPVFSTFFGGSGYDTGVGVAVDAPGNVFVSGHTGSSDFPLANPLQSSFRATCPDLSGAMVACRHAFLVKLDSAGDKMLYSTYFSGSNQDLGALVAVDPAGEAYLTARTQSTDLPGATGPAPQGSCPADPVDAAAHLCTQIFLAKLAPSGRLDYDVYFGGSGDEVPSGIALSPTAQPAIVGRTDSTDLPVLNAVQASPGGGSCATGGQSRPCLDGFVAQFSSADGSLAFATYLGGSGDDYATGVAFDPKGGIYVDGTTYSTGFPVTAALQGTKPDTTAGDGSCFLTKLNPGGQIVYSTYLGGSQDTECNAVAADAAGDAFVGGSAAGAAGLPLANAIQATYGGSDADGYLAEVNPAGSAVIFGTLLGGSGHDEIDAMALGSAGTVSVGGWTASNGFPVTTSQTLSGGSDGFVANIDPAPPKPVTCPKHATLKKNGKCACKKGYTLKKGKCVKKKPSGTSHRL